MRLIRVWSNLRRYVNPLPLSPTYCTLSPVDKCFGSSAKYSEYDNSGAAKAADGVEKSLDVERAQSDAAAGAQAGHPMVESKKPFEVRSSYGIALGSGALALVVGFVAGLTLGLRRGT